MEPAHFVLYSDGEGHGEYVQDQEKVAALTTLRQAVEKQQPQEMLTWVNACRRPLVRKDCTRAAIADRLHNGPIAYRWKKLGGEADSYRSCVPLQEVMATKRTRRTAEWTRRTHPARPHALKKKASEDRAARGNMARQLLDLLPKSEHENGR